MRVAAADAWTALLLMSLIEVVVPATITDVNTQPDTTTAFNIQQKMRPNKKKSEKAPGLWKVEGSCGDDELGLCLEVDECNGRYVDWPKGSNKCSKGERCCRRKTSYGCSTEDGKACKFPFLYNNIWYDDCTTVDSDPGKAWCSYRQDDDGNHIKGKYGICNSNCAAIRCMECDLNSKRDQFFIHPSDCRKYLQCTPTGPKEKTCPEGTHWDQSHLTCDAEHCPCVTANYINKDGSCITEDDMCRLDHGCKQKYNTCSTLMCSLPSNFKKNLKKCVEEMDIDLPEKEHDDDDHFMGDGHNHTHHEVHLCARPFRPNHPRRDWLMRNLEPTTAANLRKCILNKSDILQTWDDLVNRGVMLAQLYPSFLDYPELHAPIKDAIENTCQEPVDYQIHDFYRCVHQTCVKHIVLQTDNVISKKSL